MRFSVVKVISASLLCGLSTVGAAIALPKTGFLTDAQGWVVIPAMIFAIASFLIWIKSVLGPNPPDC